MKYCFASKKKNIHRDQLKIRVDTMEDKEYLLPTKAAEVQLNKSLNRILVAGRDTVNTQPVVQ